jgi:lipid-A-disaccharide synthase
MALASILVVTGEASGDQHAARVVAELSRRRSDLRFFGMGGPQLAAEGVELLYGAHEISVMGFTEVLPRLRRILTILRGLEQAAVRRHAAAALLVDIPDFNLRLAARLKDAGIKVVYYVSPMVWAWRKGRVHSVAENTERMLCILPFEPALYRGSGARATYVGNPVADEAPAAADAAHFRKLLGLPVGSPTLALLPGSRPGEIRRVLPTLVEAARRLSQKKQGLQLVVPAAPGVDIPMLEQRFAQAGLTARIFPGRAPEVVGASDVAVVTSGTATLEAGLMHRPLVVVYKTSGLNYALGRLLIRAPNISLVNLLLGETVVPELLQGQMTPDRIVREVEKVWPGGPAHEETIQKLGRLRSALGPAGASKRVAEAVLQMLF